jgi:uncharacterized protein YqeY
MSLRTQLEDDIRDAMRARDELKRDTLRMVVAAVKQAEIDLDRDMTDDEVLKVLATARKTRVDAAEQFEAAGRTDLAAIERAQIEVVVGYLPQQLNDDELRTVVQELIAELGASGPQAKGQVMKALMGRHRGRVDGKAAQQLLGELLP